MRAIIMMHVKQGKFTENFKKIPFVLGHCQIEFLCKFAKQGFVLTPTVPFLFPLLSNFGPL